MRTFFTSLTLVVPATVAITGACADTDADCEDTLTCPTSTTASGGTGTTGSAQGGSGGTSGVTGSATSSASGTGGIGGSMSEGGAAGEVSSTGGVSGAGGSMSGCDGELTPGEDACVIDELYGIFVSPDGDDVEGEGTREAPFQTLQRAADAAALAGKRVYACASRGEFTGALALSDDHGGLAVYGSFDCGDWSYDTELRAAVAPESGTALRVSGLTGGLLLRGFAFESADALEPGESSIAAFIESSEGVVLDNVAIHAGDGAAGLDGVTQAVTFPDKSELDGVNGTADDGGVMEEVECLAGGSTRGGPGGDSDPSDGSLGTPNHDGPGGEGGTIDPNCVDGLGKPGAPGPFGSDGAGAATLGSLSSAGWAPSAGADGGPGQPGQGGGGGAGAATGGGGSGGAGGCGGSGGAAGGGGGASIALLLVTSEVSLVDSVLTSAQAGRGGAGDVGQQGQQEVGDFGAGDPPGCQGGRGGIGGDGGAGGGGAGGISIGIAYQGTAAMLSNTEVTPGAAGSAGEGAGDANDGIAGVAEPELEILAG